MCQTLAPKFLVIYTIENHDTEDISLRREIHIKGHTIDNNKPLICLPIMASEKEMILSEAKRLIEAGGVMLEWRADYYQDLCNDEATLEVLRQLKEICKNTVLLVTIRSTSQGGKGTLTGKALIHTLELIGESHCGDMMDVEFFEMDQPRAVIHHLQKEGQIVISSHHDFHETPSIAVMNMLLQQMAEGDADIVKLAVMPQSVSDVLDLLKVTNDFYEEYKETPIITMSMGKLGMISRISGEVFGSCVTFGTMGECSAPGQLPMEELQRALDFMHHNYVE